MAIYFNEYFGEQLVAAFYFSFLQLTGCQVLENLLSNPDHISVLPNRN